MHKKIILLSLLTTLSFFATQPMHHLHNPPPDYLTESLHPSAEQTTRDQLLKDLQYPFKDKFLTDMQDAIRDLDCDKVQAYMDNIAVLTAKQTRILHTLLNYKDESLSLKALLFLEQNDTEKYKHIFDYAYARFYAINRKIRLKEPEIEIS